MNHYKWLEKHLTAFLHAVGIVGDNFEWLLHAHGDKVYGAQYQFERSGVPFYHGAAMYLMLAFEPFASQVRQTANGWVDPFSWIIANYESFKDKLPVILLHEEEVQHG